MSKLIGCDLDGVVTDFIRHFSTLCHTINSEAPIITSYMNVPTWDLHEWYPMPDVIETAWSFIKRPFSVFWETMPPLFPADLAQLRTLNQNREIVFITRRDGPNAYEQTINCLQDYGILDPTVIRQRAGEERDYLCQQLGIEAMIDDNPNTIPRLLNAGLRVITPPWPYLVPTQTQYSTSDRLFVAKTLGEALQLARV